MNTSNFRDALAYEKLRMPQADQYYKDKWRAVNITRWSWEDLTGKEYQKKDIDVTVTLPNSREINVSEKFYSKEYKNFVFELESHGKPGWSCSTESDGICVFTPEYCYELNSNDVRSFADSVYDTCMGMVSSPDFSRKEVSFTVPDTPVHGTLRQSYSKSGRGSWNGTILLIGWEDLEKLSIKYRKKSL